MNEIIDKPPMVDHVSHILWFSLMLILVVLKRQFLKGTLDKRMHYLSGFRENQFLQPVKWRFLMEMMTE